jgi:hypothetical protein
MMSSKPSSSPKEVIAVQSSVENEERISETRLERNGPAEERVSSSTEPANVAARIIGMKETNRYLKALLFKKFPELSPPEIKPHKEARGFEKRTENTSNRTMRRN